MRKRQPLSVWRKSQVHGGGSQESGLGAIEVRVTGPSSVAALTDAMRFGKLLGKSHAMRVLYPLCERLAATVIPVVIEGETGTGKEVLAEAMHEASPRANGPFVVFDCTAVPPSLLENIHDIGEVEAKKGYDAVQDYKRSDAKRLDRVHIESKKSTTVPGLILIVAGSISAILSGLFGQWSKHRIDYNKKAY